MPIFAIKYTGIRSVPANTILGNNTGSTGSVKALTPEELNAMGVGGNPFDQDLNTTDEPEFLNLGLGPVGSYGPAGRQGNLNGSIAIGGGDSSSDDFILGGSAFLKGFDIIGPSGNRIQFSASGGTALEVNNGDTVDITYDASLNYRFDVDKFSVYGNTIDLVGNLELFGGATFTPLGANTTILQGGSLSPQTFYIANDYRDDPLRYEVGFLRWDTGVFEIGTTGTGGATTNADVKINIGGNDVVTFSQTGVTFHPFSVNFSGAYVGGVTALSPSSESLFTSLGYSSLRYQTAYLGGVELTADRPMLNLEQTFNEGATDFVAAYWNLTNTASNSLKAVKVDVDGSEIFSVGTSAGVTGIQTDNWRNIAAGGRIQLGGDESTHYQSVRVFSGSDYIGWGTGSRFYQPTVNQVELRNGLNPQAFHVYTEYQDASNYLRFAIDTDDVSSSAVIKIEELGAVTRRRLELEIGEGFIISHPSDDNFFSMQKDRFIGINVNGFTANTLKKALLIEARGTQNEDILALRGNDAGWSSDFFTCQTSSDVEVFNIGSIGNTTITSGTVTTSTPMLDLSQTWNDAAQTFYGAVLDVTVTAANEATFTAGTSALLDLRADGFSMFKFQRKSNGASKLVFGEDLQTSEIAWIGRASSYLQLGGNRILFCGSTDSAGYGYAINNAGTPTFGDYSNRLQFARSNGSSNSIEFGPYRYLPSGDANYPSHAVIQGPSNTVQIVGSTTTDPQTVNIYNTYTLCL